jgi:hypothetical protein
MTPVGSHPCAYNIGRLAVKATQAVTAAQGNVAASSREVAKPSHLSFDEDYRSASSSQDNPCFVEAKFISDVVSYEP